MASDNWRRVVTLTQGRAMLVTDLHGDWELYVRYRDRFLREHEAGNLQHLIFSGDLIHRESSSQQDKSLEIVLDVLALEESYPDRVTYLCGNHELPHIYSITLAKGDIMYTPRFEERLGEHRQRVIEAFRTLPFFVRTAAGVVITHAGASAPFSLDEHTLEIFNFDHQAVFDIVDELLLRKDLEALRRGIGSFSGQPYDQLVQAYLAVNGRDDPRYDDFLRGFVASSAPEFQRLWTMLFTRCEYEYPKAEYIMLLESLFKALSAGFQPQRFLVAGHLDVRRGFEVVVDRHLRLASGKHALLPNAVRYLVFDVSQPIHTIDELLAGLYSVYH